MSDFNLPQYTFLSWYRKGLVNYVDSVDTIGATGPIGMPSIKFGLELNDDSSNVIEKDIDIFGPGHITGVNERVIIKTFPENNVTNAPWANLAYVEFYEEDFPWRYTPAKADGNRLRPWVSLLVLKEGEFSIRFDPNAPLPYIDLPMLLEDSTPNPALDIPSDNIWAWAHVQINKALQTDKTDVSKHADLTNEIDELIRSNPDVALSRLVCPRKLEAEAKYTAFLIPSFEVGRLAGLGEDASTTEILRSSWTSTDLNTAAKKMPFYHHWTFSTGEDGDFETLAQKLKPKSIQNVTPKTLNIESLTTHFYDEIMAQRPFATSPNTTKKIDIDTALTPQVYTLDDWPQKGTSDAFVLFGIAVDLNKQVGTKNASELEDPVVNIPPLYGQHYINLTNLMPNTWLQESNLNPRDRAITALGASIVKKNQDTFMTQAWAKIGEIQEINKRIYQAQLGKVVNSQIYERHIVRNPESEILAQTKNLHTKIPSQTIGSLQTIHKEIKESNLGLSATNSGFLKLRHSSGKVGKKLAKQVAQYMGPITTQSGHLNEGLIPKINNTTANEKIQGSLPKPSPYATALNVSSSVFGELNVQPVVKAALNIAGTKTAVLNTINPEHVFPKKTQAQIKLNNTNTDELQLPSVDKIEPILAAPKIELPLYQYLVELSQDFIIPDITDLGNNFVALLEVNQAFVEKVLLGANHEMAKELLWRGYPTDQRGTCFNHFWDTRNNPNSSTPLKDITDIHTWGATLLGTHNTRTGSMTALVVKGDLLEAYPNTVIYAHQAVLDPSLNTNTNTVANVALIQNPNGTVAVNPMTSLPVANVAAIGSDRLLNPTVNDQTVRYPVFQARLKPNLLVLGFDLSVDELLGQNQPTPSEGWFFMFKERPGEPQFGMDEQLEPTSSTLDSWDDLAWQHLANPSFVDLDQSLNATNSSVNWNEDAASMAHILYQSPVLMGIHASNVIDT
jgi:hypothetical protein